MLIHLSIPSSPSLAIYIYIKQLSNKHIFGEDYFLLEVKE